MIDDVIRCAWRGQYFFAGWIKTLQKNAALLILAIFLPCITAADDQISRLKILPDRCISLHQGQVCYQLATVSWQVPMVSNYCLFQDQDSVPLRCWQSANQGELKIDFQSAKPINYHLHEKGHKAAIASSTLDVSWVYQSPKRRTRSWRLF